MGGNNQGHWIKSHDHLIKEFGVNVAAVFGVIEYWSDRNINTLDMYMTRDKIAVKLNMSERSITSFIGKLKDAGYIDVIKEKVTNFGNAQNKYKPTAKAKSILYGDGNLNMEDENENKSEDNSENSSDYVKCKICTSPTSKTPLDQSCAKFAPPTRKICTELGAKFAHHTTKERVIKENKKREITRAGAREASLDDSNGDAIGGVAAGDAKCNDIAAGDVKSNDIAAGDVISSAFNQLWKDYYPVCGASKGSKKSAYKAYRKSLKKYSGSALEEKQREISSGIMKYLEWCNATQTFNKHLVSAINQQVWEDEGFQIEEEQQRGTPEGLAFKRMYRYIKPGADIGADLIPLWRKAAGEIEPEQILKILALWINYEWMDRESKFVPSPTKFLEKIVFKDPPTPFGRKTIDHKKYLDKAVLEMGDDTQDDDTKDDDTQDDERKEA